MDFKVNDISESEKEVEVTLPYDEIKNDIDVEVKKQTRNIQVPGFRKGKAPKHIIKRKYGDALEYEASEKVANSRFWDIAKEKDLRPIGQPVMIDLHFHPGEEFKFKVKYEIVPEIEVKEYTGQSIEVPDLKVTAVEVEKEIEHILRSNSTKEDADVVGDDENYILDAELTMTEKNGETVTDSKPEKMQIDLSNKDVHTDIKTNAKGKKVGEKFNFQFHDEQTIQNKDGKDEKVKEDYNYEVHLIGIKKIVLPELNEELIKKATKDKFSTEEDLRKEIEKNIQNYYEQRADEFARNQLISLIISKNDFTPPSFMVESILNEMVKSEEERMKKQGMKKIDTKYLREYLQPSALNEVKWYQIKSEILKKENLEVSDSELEEQAKTDSEKTGLPIDKLMNYYKSSNQLERMLDKKLFDFLKEKNEIKKVNPEKLAQKQKEEKV